MLPFPASFPHMNSEWLRIGPEVIYWAPRLAAKVWNIETIYISENGTSSEDKLHADGKVYDLDRIMYSAQLSARSCSARWPRACRSAAISSGA